MLFSKREAVTAWRQRHRMKRVGSGLAAVALFAVSIPVSAQTGDPCPAPVPAVEVVTGMEVTGLTVSQGTTPDEFTGEVLGVLRNGIGAGLDLIIVDLRGSVITDEDGNVDRGVWAGMSGSPVYDEDGRLLGAVAYSLAFSPSSIAGVTPADAMYNLIGGGPAPTQAAPAEVELTDKVANALVATGAATVAQANEGMQRLPLPMQVSGLSAQHLKKLTNRLGITQPYVVGAAAPITGQSIDIVAGGNLVASLSHGDVTQAAIGTATAVCGDEVIAFGHPLLWNGATTLAMHGADTIHIQTDSFGGSFKVANPGEPNGKIDNDRLAGISGITGELFPTSLIRARVTSTEGGLRYGESHVTLPSEVPFVAAFHLLSNADRVFDQIGKGSARVTFVAQGERQNGESFVFSRTNRFSNGFDITFESIFESLEMLSRIQNNRFANVSIDEVSYRAEYDPVVRNLRVTSFDIRRGGQWVAPERPLRVKAGSELRVRAHLRPSVGGPEKLVVLSVQVPNLAGARGVLRVGRPFDLSGRPGSFNQLLSQMRATPRNDEVGVLLDVFRDGTVRVRQDKAIAGAVVRGAQQVRVRIVP